jgi:hypothetical protein
MFSYEDYREILRLIRESGRQATYEEALHRDEFIIMRHDVEYSVDRAFELSKVEESMDFRSTFFFQWTNNSYNILSRRNRDILTEMHERGQHIGLHFALNGMTDMDLVRSRIRQEMDMLSNMLGFEVKCVLDPPAVARTCSLRKTSGSRVCLMPIRMISSVSIRRHRRILRWK